MTRKDTDCTPVHQETVEQVRGKMPDQVILGNLTEFFKVMGDSTRLKILWALDKSEICVADISVLLNITKSAVSHQLSALKSSNLIRARKEGKHVFYSLNDEHVRLVLEMAVEHVEEYR